MTITNLDSLSVKAGFAETDAVKLQVGQPAVITFSALPNVQAAGVVTEVDASSTLVSNVVTYYATVGITQVPAGVKPGMTSSVTVTVSRRDGVVTVPSAAVRGTGTTGTVTVVTGKQQTTETVGVGLRGDTLTEITSGLNVGATVVLPSSTVSGVSSQVSSSNAGRFLTGGSGIGGSLGGGTGTGRGTSGGAGGGSGRTGG
jgi:multidrug efflux pump subunit AcrA (membrane-fusion protein)